MKRFSSVRSVFALRENARPSPDTRLYTAPYYNVWEDGAICVGNVSTPERILLCGTDQMAFFASYLRHLLMLLDVRAEIAASPSQEALSRLGRIDERTLVIGLSAGRPHPLVVRAM